MPRVLTSQAGFGAGRRSKMDDLNLDLEEDRFRFRRRCVTEFANTTYNDLVAVCLRFGAHLNTVRNRDAAIYFIADLRIERARNVERAA